MQYLAFHNLVKSFINRKDVTDAQVDYFVNTASRELQQRQPLNFTISQVATTYPSTGGVGVALSTLTANLYRSLADDYSVTITGLDGAKVPLHGDTKQNVARRYRWGNPPNPNQWPQVNTTTFPISTQTIVYYVDYINTVSTLFLYPEVASAPLGSQYYAWLPDYDYAVAPTKEDYLLRVGNQVLLYGALVHANTFFGEDAKLPLYLAQFEKSLVDFIMTDSTARITGAELSLD